MTELSPAQRLAQMRKRAERCVTHHGACDCQQHENMLLDQKQFRKIANLEAQNWALRELVAAQLPAEYAKFVARFGSGE